MKWLRWALATAVFAAAWRAAQGAPSAGEEKDAAMASRVQWDKFKIDKGDFESCAVFDVNMDGHLDILCGGWWYEGPDFTRRFKVCDLPHVGGKDVEYYDDFGCVPMDVNGDGWLDIVTGGWFSKQVVWRENPKAADREWTTHVIDEGFSSEIVLGHDIDGDGQLEIVPNTPAAPLRFYKLILDEKGRGTGRFETIFIDPDPAAKSGHGLGFGDVNGDGSRDIVVPTGWWEAPADPLRGKWIFHDEFDLGRMSCPIIVNDLLDDGLAELVVGNGHGFGLDYWRQDVDKDGEPVWTRSPIDPFFSQYHCLKWVDIDGDGQNEIVTGNRYRAHCGHDPGETDEVGLYYFKWNGEFFTKVVIDHGVAGKASGTGLWFEVVDIDNDGRLDIVAPGKEGLYLFRNKGVVTDNK
ncbi:MAG: FG-GAP repeat protein [candidate division BRC1 bacterium ADurb.BinA364]|nr:MAG: FG-GAP repeat protein [candidate division BRC1 bacterium ADurb.BinA364]